MHISVTSFRVGRFALGFLALAGSVLLLSAPKKTAFTPHDRAYYAAADTVNFVRPGLNITIVSATIANDGTIKVNYKLADPRGLPLDRLGIQTPGTISVSFIAAYIPKGASEYYAYTTRTQTSPITNVSAIQAGADAAGGTHQEVAVGEYNYTFRTKAVAKGGGAFDATATHRIGAYGSRNLTEFDLGTDRDSEVFDFIPGGGKAAIREVIKTESCNSCHDSLAAHGGSRRGLELCIMCHTDQTTDPDTGNTVEMSVMTHKIHMGEHLPSVKAGGKYNIIGNSQSNHDYSTVAYPAVGGIESVSIRCESCHEQNTKALQADAYFKNPTRAACGSCHDDVNFATGKNHSGSNLPMASDKQCSTCHVPEPELEYDASIKGAHMVDTESPSRPGLVVNILRVDNGVAGKAPTVTFTAKDFSGAPVPMKNLTTSPDRIGLVLAGPTSDYGYTSFGTDVTTRGYVSENPAPTASCGSDGTCTYTFSHKIPADAKGTFAIGIEGRRGQTILPGTEREIHTEYGADNKVFYFSVDGSPVQPRRKVVDIAKCNSCHIRLSLHGENRNQIEQCVLCHNASMTDFSRRPSATNPADKAAPDQSVNFALMIHKIHTGERMHEFGNTYTVVGFGGSHNDFSEVRYPVMTPSGSAGDTAKCYMCHVNNSEARFPIGKNKVLDPQGKLSPVDATTSACTACHQNTSALAHALVNTDDKFGESCDVCHGIGKDFDVLKSHAGK